MCNHVITRALSIFLSVMLTICSLDIPYQVYAKEPETGFLTAKVLTRTGYGAILSAFKSILAY